VARVAVARGGAARVGALGAGARPRCATWVQKQGRFVCVWVHIWVQQVGKQPLGDKNIMILVETHFKLRFFGTS
jgi:hypothetical protein